MNNQPSRATVTVLGFAFGLAVLWSVLALVRPSTTFHLAPFLVAATPGLFSRFDGPSGVSVRLLAALHGLTITLALTATGVLAVAGGLMGPSLLPFGGAALESIVGSVAGGLLGLALVRRRSQIVSA